MDAMMLNDVKAYLVSCFRWPIPCCKQHTEVFPLVLQDKCEPNIQITVIILARIVFRPVIFNRGLALRLQH